MTGRVKVIVTAIAVVLAFVLMIPLGVITWTVAMVAVAAVVGWLWLGYGKWDQ